MAVAGALFMVLVALTVLFIARGELATERTERARAIVDAVTSMAESYKHAAESGAMSDEEAKARFYAASGAVWFEGHTNYVFIYDTETGLCVMNAGNPALVGKDVRGLKDAAGLPFASMMLDMARRGEGTIRYTFPRGGAKTPLEKIAYVRGFAPWHLMIASAEYMTDLDVTFWNMAQTVAALIGVLLLLSIGIAWLVARSVVKPLYRLRSRMDVLSKGELTPPVMDTDRSDEIGEMARTVGVFKEAMIETNRLRAEQVEAEQRQMQQRKADMHRMADNFEGAVGQIIATVSSASGELEQSAGVLTSTATRSEELATKVAGASEEASSNVQSVASATEELSSSVHEISRQVQESARMANEAVAQARQTNDRVGELSTAAVLRSWRRKSRRWPSKPRKPPARSVSRSTAFRRQRMNPWARSRKSAAPSKSSRRSPRPLRPRWNSRAPRPRKYPATSSAPRKAPCRSPPTLAMCNAVPARPDRLRRRFCRLPSRYPAIP